MSDDAWGTVKIPRTCIARFRRNYEGWLMRALSEGIKLPDGEQGRLVAFWEYVMQDFGDSQDYIVDRLLLDMTEEARNKYYAKLRDDFKCLVCKTQHTNKGTTITSHHITPRGARGTAEQHWMKETFGSIDAIENLATLCDQCHSRAHHDWRKSARWLYQQIGTEFPEDLFR